MIGRLYENTIVKLNNAMYVAYAPSYSIKNTESFNLEEDWTDVKFLNIGNGFFPHTIYPNHSFPSPPLYLRSPLYPSLQISSVPGPLHVCDGCQLGSFVGLLTAGAAIYPTYFLVVGCHVQP